MTLIQIIGQRRYARGDRERESEKDNALQAPISELTDNGYNTDMHTYGGTDKRGQFVHFYPFICYFFVSRTMRYSKRNKFSEVRKALFEVPTTTDIMMYRGTDKGYNDVAGD